MSEKTGKRSGSNWGSAEIIMELIHEKMKALGLLLQNKSGYIKKGFKLRKRSKLNEGERRIISRERKYFGGRRLEGNWVNLSVPEGQEWETSEKGRDY